MSPVSALNSGSSQVLDSHITPLVRRRSACQPDNLSCSVGSSNCSLCCSCRGNGNIQGMLSLLFSCFSQCLLWRCDCWVLLDLKPPKHPTPSLRFLYNDKQQLLTQSWLKLSVSIMKEKECTITFSGFGFASDMKKLFTKLSQLFFFAIEDHVNTLTKFCRMLDQLSSQAPKFVKKFSSSQPKFLMQ